MDNLPHRNAAGSQTEQIQTNDPPVGNIAGGSGRPRPDDWGASSDAHLRQVPNRYFAHKITAIFLVAGLVLSPLSDELVRIAVPNPAIQDWMENLRIEFLVIVASLILFLLLRAAQSRELAMMARLYDAIGASRDGLWRWDVRNESIVTTPGGDAELGWPAARAIHGIDDWRRITHPDDWAQVDQRLQTLEDQGTDDWRLQQRFLTADGGWHWMEIKGRVIERDTDGRVAVMEGLYHSIDALKRAQEAAERSNRVLRILVDAYDAAATSATSAEALNTLVQRIASSSDYPVAWVGEAMNDPLKRIVPKAWAGPAAEFAAHGVFRWDDSPYANGPSGRCVKTGRPCFTNNSQGSAESLPWAEELIRYGIRSGVSVPISAKSGQTYVLHIASSSPDRFSEDDADLYAMISGALALIVDSADTAFQFSQSEVARVEIAERLKKAMDGTIVALATVIDKRDPYTAGHQHRVADLALAIGTEMGLDPDRLEGLRIGAGIHDIGKIGVPTEILSKPGRLDEVEIALIKRHAEIGYQIVKNIDFGWPIEKIVRQHHERWDGSGYPDGLKGTDINLEARIVAVADVIESMGTNRPYRNKIPWDIVLNEIKSGRGVRYDPSVVDAALKILEGNVAKFGLG